MAVTSTPIFPQTPFTAQNVIVSGTGAYTFVASTAQSNLTGLVAIKAGGTNGSVVEAINVTTSDTAANTLWLMLINASTGTILSVQTIAIGSGVTVTVPPVNVFTSSQAPALPYDVNGNKYLYLPSGMTLYAGTTAAVTALKQVSIQATGADF